MQVSTDTAENRDSVNADQSLLENVPIFDQDYVAAMSAFLDAGSLGTNGAQLIIKGVEVTSATITASAIQQVRINQISPVFRRKMCREADLLLKIFLSRARHKVIFCAGHVMEACDG